MIKRFFMSGGFAIVLGFCGLIYGLLYASLGNYILSYAEFRCVETSLVGKSPNRTEQCVKYKKIND